MAEIVLGSLEMPRKQHSDPVTLAFNYHRSPASYLIHPLAFNFIIESSSIIPPIYTLGQACTAAINISVAGFVRTHVRKEILMCFCASPCVAAINI